MFGRGEYPRKLHVWRGTLVQYAGRLHRLHPNKHEVPIFDYVDREVPTRLRMFAKRLPGNRAIGYARGEAPLGYAETTDDLTVDGGDMLRPPGVKTSILIVKRATDGLVGRQRHPTPGIRGLELTTRR